MKCEICRKRMKTQLRDTVIDFDGTPVKVKNVPAFVCSDCGSEIIHDIVIKRAKNYICQYGAEDNTIDFHACEEKETEDTIVVMQMLGML